jgi:2'-5' RNA ligase
MKRLFIAIKIVPDSNLLKVYNDLKKKCYHSRVKWVDENLFHITLKFFGEIPENEIETITDIMEQTASGFGAFEFDIKGLGVFGSSYRPRVIWFGLHNNEGLKSFGNLLLDELDKAGFPRDRQNFVPHLTVGRIKFIKDKNLLREIVHHHKESFFQHVLADKIILYESVLKKDGPQYFPLKEVYINK